MHPEPRTGADGERRRPTVAVVGAGVSGLTAAWRLAADGAADVVVLEARDAVGGVVRIGDVDGLRLDLGAEAVLARRPEALDLIHELGLGDDVVHPATSTASVVARGVRYPLPAGTVMGVPGDPAALRGILTDAEVARAAAERSLPRTPVTDDVDVASWVGGRLGPAVVERLVEPLLGGVYAGHAARLSLRATLPQLWDAAVAGGSLLDAVTALTALTAAGGTAGSGGEPRPVFAGLRGGVGRLPETLAARLVARGVRIRTRTTVRGLRRAPDGWRLELGDAARAGGAPAEVLDVAGVVLAVPAPAAARLLAREVPAAVAELAAVETASVALVTLLLPRAEAAGLTGSGLLVPPVEGRAVKAATFSAAKWRWVDELDADRVAVRASLGRAGEAAVLQRPDDDLVALAVADLAEVTGRPVRPLAHRVTRWGGGLPQYGVGHVDSVVRLRAAVAAAGNLAICGAVLDGVGIPACVAAATGAARDLRDRLGAAGARMPA